MESENDHLIAVIGLPEIMVSTPRLLAWGAMLQIPYRRTLQLVVEVADIIPPNSHHTPLSDYDIDTIRDAIGYVMEDDPTPYIPGDQPFSRVALTQFETMVIKAAKRVREILGPEITECHFVDVRQSNYIVIEVFYGL
jgi:hypothetical protein